MAEIIYCDRCGKQITSGKDAFEGFDLKFRSMASQYPQLCGDCDEKFKVVIKNFLDEGKKAEDKPQKKKFGLF